MTNTPVITLHSHSPAVVHPPPTSSYLVDSLSSSLTNTNHSSPATQVTTAQSSQQETGSVPQHQIQPYLQRSQIHSRQQLSSHQIHPLPQQTRMDTTGLPPPNTTNMNDLRYGCSVSDWVGSINKEKSPCLPLKNDWKDVDKNIKQMDQLYDATFYSWLKAEDNVLVTAMYLHRIANEYSLERIIHAVKWLVSDWRWESTSILVRHITVGWCDEEGDIRRAQLLRHLTATWATQYTATFISAILTSPPYTTASNIQRERFTRAFTDGWGFSKLSEFFMYLSNQANINYKAKCLMLQEAAGRERKKLCAKLDRRRQRQYYNEGGNNATTLSTTTSPLSSSPPPSNTFEKNSESVNEQSSYSSVHIEYHHSDASITQSQYSLRLHQEHHHHYHHRSGLNFDDQPLEISSRGSSQVSTSSLPSRLAETSHQNQQQQSHARYHHHHHRRISSSDMMDVKRQRFSAAFDEDSTENDHNQDEKHRDTCNYIISSSNSGSSSTRTNKNSPPTSSMTATTPSTSDAQTKGLLQPSPPSTTTTNDSNCIQSQLSILYNGNHDEQAPPAENGNLTNNLSGMGLGSAVHGGSSAGSGTSTPSSTASSPSATNIPALHHQRQLSNSSNEISVPGTNSGRMATRLITKTSNCDNGIGATGKDQDNNSSGGSSSSSNSDLKNQ